MSSFRFVHAADLHLDKPFRRLAHVPTPLYRQLQKAPLEAFERLVDFCIRENVDFVCLSGDLYELEKGRLEGPLALQKGLWRLHHAGIHAFLIRGNHDPDDGRHPQLEWPPTAHWFSSRQVEAVPFYKEGREVARVYGFSYPAAEFRENVARQFRRDADAPFSVAMLHTNVDGIGGHENYAPSRLGELSASGMDYWALGHIHQRKVVRESPWVVYPGNIQARRMRETGEKGGYLVEVEDGRVSRLTFVPFSPVVCRSWTVDVSDIGSEEALLARLRKTLHAVRPPSMDVAFQGQPDFGVQPSDKGTITVVRLELAGTTKMSARLQRVGVLDDLAALLNEENGWFQAADDAMPPGGVWVADIVNRTMPPLNLDSYPLLRECVMRLRSWRNETLERNGYLAELIRHPAAGKYLDDWSEDDWDTVLQEAESLLVSLMAASWEDGQ